LTAASQRQTTCVVSRAAAQAVCHAMAVEPRAARRVLPPRTLRVDDGGPGGGGDDDDTEGEEDDERDAYFGGDGGAGFEGGCNAAWPLAGELPSASAADPVGILAMTLAPPPPPPAGALGAPLAPLGVSNGSSFFLAGKRPNHHAPRHLCTCRRAI
jgi:hypothetical protein